MTREEAITIFKRMENYFHGELFTDADIDMKSALSMAIEALEQEPCEDCISKKAVLDKINEICFSREQESVDFRVAQGSNGQRDLIINFIENLPSVQSKPKTGYWNTYEITQGGINEEWIECSECMWSNALVIPRNYCPNCGCKMEVIGDDNRRSN